MSTKKTLCCGERLLDLSRPVVMGILNITPDSFYADSRYAGQGLLLERAGAMLEAGAAILDIGGYSTRPGAEDVPEEEELERVLPAVRQVRETYPQAFISVDTFRSRVAAAAIAAGADLINDVSGGSLDPDMFATAARLQVPYILMHLRGTPQTMQQHTDYDNLLPELLTYFEAKVAALRQAGVKDILLDPGFGFAKTPSQGFTLLQRLRDFQWLGLPVLVGISRKSMVYKSVGSAPEGALNGTTALHMAALLNGAALLRVHDVAEAVQTVQLFLKLQHAGAEN